MEEKRDRVHLAFDSICSQDTSTSGEKPPIILLHGVTNAKETWKNVLHPIAQATGRKVYAFDARNHGDSGWSERFGYGAMQDDLLQFMDCLHAQQAILIGHSMGGKTVMYFALKWPEKVEKLIIEDISPKAAPPDIRENAVKYVQLLRHVLKKIPENIVELSEAKKFANKCITGTESKAEGDSSNDSESDSSFLPLTQDPLTQKFKWKTNLDVIEENYLKGSPSSIYVEETYQGPTLFLWGTKSPYKVTADRDFILEHFPDARFRAVEGASHQIHQYYEDVFLEEVIHFINEAR